MKLFYAPGTRAECVRWMLDEMGVAYDIVQVDMSCRLRNLGGRRFIGLDPFFFLRSFTRSRIASSRSLAGT